MTDSRGCEHEGTQVETASNRLNGVADPEGATPPLRASQKRESTLAIRDVDPPSGKSTLAVLTSLDVPLVAARVCRSCGNPSHMLPASPVLYYTDTNNDHSIQWSESVVGQAWLANGEAMWQERLILPG